MKQKKENYLLSKKKSNYDLYQFLNNFLTINLSYNLKQKQNEKINFITKYCTIYLKR